VSELVTVAVMELLLALLFCASAHAYFSKLDDPILHIRKYGFDQDHETYSHELVVPWVRPFKPGYCDSWEWHTHQRYKPQRMELCKSLSGDRSHDCTSPSAFCVNKCPYKNGSYPFWRIRNADAVPTLWAIRTIQMFETPTTRQPMKMDPSKGYASNFFGPGYYASNAFDNNPDSIWVSNGISTPGLNWIAYEFESPVKVTSIRVVGESEHPERIPSEFYVEASCEKYFKTFTQQWMVDNRKHMTDKRYHKPRDQATRKRR